MDDTIKPRDRSDVEAAVQWALGDGKSLEIVGHGSKRAFGRPSQHDATLDLSALSGVTLYEPQELVLSAKAGTPLAEIDAVLAAQGQALAFEPMDYGPVLGEPEGRSTIGGVVAASLSGPRRIKVGTVRDHFLGVTAVSGRGETFKSGGRVVKNVTGYDLCKLLAGSWGTLGIMTDITLKVLPQPEAEATLVLYGLNEREAGEAMTKAMGSSFDVSGAAHLPDYLAARLDGVGRSDAATLLRIEGIKPSVVHRIEGLERALRPIRAMAKLDERASRPLWRAIRDARPLAADTEVGSRPLWRISTAPEQGCEIAARISPASQLFFDWAGGLVWVAPPAAPDCGAAAIRRAVAEAGGHATLVRGPAAARASVDVFEPAGKALAGLTKRVKESFDPKGVLNPGRMWAGV
jgi:glycolate dehydrogenase FAD-binding subunit